MGKVQFNNMGITVEKKSKILIDVINLVTDYVTNNYTVPDREKIFEEIDEIVGFKIEKHDMCNAELTYDRMQTILSSINEVGINRKNKGVYYTPHDLVNFIVINLAKLSCGKLKPNNLHILDLNGIPYEHFCYQKTVFDPTCGAGEFLLVSLDIKLDLLELHNENVTRGNIVKVLDTIYGNDIDVDSITITKIRLLLTILHRFGVTKIKGLATILNSKFTIIDYVESPNKVHETFDIIVGNPPYVEDSKSDTKPPVKYGNIYANVLENSSQQLNEFGVFGYVIPLSYVSTLRMKKIRNVLDSRLPEQFILSYADRPDCLFTSVHQKLNVMFAKKSRKKAYYTSNYQYWYKDERKKLFEDISAIKNNFIVPGFIPKIGNKKDSEIFQKVYSTVNTITDYYDVSGKSIYLNMRATFWIKAFLKEHYSAEYKQLNFDENVANLMMCIFNSSLFWWFWVCVSDCWHITNKELSSFRIPTNFDPEEVSKFASILENRLEETKVYVGTKQTEYEYKHKDCVDIIHQIDDYIAELYGLTTEENLYVKNFNLRYRLGGGADI